MDIYVLDRSLAFTGIVDEYSSVIWTTRYFTPGDFELYLPASCENIALLQKDFYLCREEDIDGEKYRNVMIIENIRLRTDIENGNDMTVSGKCLKSLLSRRVIWNQTNIYGNLETGIRKILTENVVSPEISERRIADFTLGKAKGFADRVDIQVTGGEVSAFLKEVCTAYGIGWDIYIENRKFVFDLYKGADRSYNQMENPYVIFSPEYDNLLESDYVYAKERYKNVALVAGEGEGSGRAKTAVGDASGLDRYEMFVDARDVSSNNGEIAPEQYALLLSERGQEKLSGFMETVNFEGQIETQAGFFLNRDYFLGDIVEVVNEYGIETAPRIIEIIDCDDNTGRTVIPAFSTWEV
ncbi:MAG: hypothetical protein HFE60_08575 [Anaerotignum sp.]|jgi:hypothetical protein|nr:hypothetical protein [Anaerotignum sp.]